jgi:hypothetical protein
VSLQIETEYSGADAQPPVMRGARLAFPAFAGMAMTMPCRHQ